MSGRKQKLANKAAREAAAAQGRTTFFFACAVLAASALMSVYIWQYTRMVEVQMQITRTEKEIHQLHEQLEYLQLQREQLARLERIDFTAQERLGMIVPGRANLRYLTVKARRTP